jgi:hypothetical protein
MGNLPMVSALRYDGRRRVRHAGAVMAWRLSGELTSDIDRTVCRQTLYVMFGP